LKLIKEETSASEKKLKSKLEKEAQANEKLEGQLRKV